MTKYIIWDWNGTRRRKVRFAPLPCSGNIRPLPCSSSRLETRVGRPGRLRRLGYALASCFCAAY